MSIIIFAIFAILVCLAAMIVDIAHEKYGAAVLMLILCLLNGSLLKTDIERYKHRDEPKVHVVTNVIKYQVDSTTMINGADTTKTYTLTYWDYEI
jgi:hypothetical protein